jgi:hypothetical protein
MAGDSIITVKETNYRIPARQSIKTVSAVNDYYQVKEQVLQQQFFQLIEEDLFFVL